MISVIIPAYNVEPYIQDCLDSLKRQTYTDFEAIVIDDASTDGTAAVAERYAAADSRFHLIRRRFNGGQSMARNDGLVAANGDYATFLDSDDKLAPYALDLMLSAAKAVSADVVETRFTFKEPRNDKEPDVSLKDIVRFDSREAMREFLYQRKISTAVCGKLFSRKMVENRRFPVGLYLEDIDYVYRVLSDARSIAMIAVPVYYYRHRPGSTLNSFTERRFHALRISREILRDVEYNHKWLLGGAKSLQLSVAFNVSRLIASHRADFMKEPDMDTILPEVERQCRDIIRTHRKGMLFDPDMRMKNKLGVLVSYLPSPVFKMLAHLF